MATLDYAEQRWTGRGLSIGSLLGAGPRLIREQPGLIAVWMAINVALLVAFQFAMRPLFAGMAAYQQQRAAEIASGIRPPVSIPPGFGTIMLFQPVFLVLMVVAFAALVRAMSWPKGDRFAYLRLGMDELRLIGLGLVLLVLALIAEMVGVIALIVVGGLLSLVLGRAGGFFAGGLGFLVFLGAMVWAEVRISLAGVYTVLEGRIVLREAWRATQGRFWTLFGAYLLAALAYLAVSLVIMAAMRPAVFSAMSTGDPRMVIAAQQSMMAGFSTWAVMLAALSGIVYVLFGVVMLGTVVEAGLELRGHRPGLAETFA